MQSRTVPFHRSRCLIPLLLMAPFAKLDQTHAWGYLELEIGGVDLCVAG